MKGLTNIAHRVCSFPSSVVPIIPLPGISLSAFASRHAADWFHRRQKTRCYRNHFSQRLKILRFLRLQRDQRLTLWYIGKRKQGVLRNHAIPQCTFLTPVGNRCITPCVCVKEPSRSRGVIPTAGGLYVHKCTVFCRNIRRNIQRYWILRRLCRSISCSASMERTRSA